MEQRFVPLLMVVLLAFIVPFVLSRFRRIPIVVGEIMAGIIVGPSLLGWVHGDEPTLELLAEIGFAFLMFLSGLEIDFSLLFASSSGKSDLKPLWQSLASFGLTIALAAAVSFGLAGGGFVGDPWMMTLILSTTSLGIVVPVLKERGLAGGRFGQTVLLAALLADFLTMFLITVYVAFHTTGLALDILLIVALFIPVVILYRFGARHLRRPGVRRVIEELAGATAQIKVRGAFALMIAFVVLAELVGAELILGAFLGGVLASLLSGPEDEDMRHKLDAIGFGFFVPLFFIYVGIRFDLNAFLADRAAWVLLPLLLLAAFAVKIISALVFRFSFPWRETLGSGLLLSARLSLIIAASAIGLRLGVISEAMNAVIILIAALTATIAPFLFNSLIAEQSDARARLFVIYGGGDLGMQVAHELQAHGERVCFVDADRETVERLHDQGFHAVHRAGGLQACLDALQDGRVEAFLALSDDDEENLHAARAARARGVGHIVAFSANPILLPEFRALGVQMVTPSLHRSALMALMARNPALFTLLTSTEDERDLHEVTLTNPTMVGKRLNELRLPGDVLVLAIRRADGEVVIPHGATRLANGDRLTLLGSLEALQNAEEMLH